MSSSFGEMKDDIEYDVGDSTKKNITVYKDGTTYIGKWSNGKFVDGKKITSHGDVYVGRWENDSFVEGKVIYDSGDVFIGKVDNEELIEGTLIGSNGKICEFSRMSGKPAVMLREKTNIGKSIFLVKYNFIQNQAKNYVFVDFATEQNYKNYDVSDVFKILEIEIPELDADNISKINQEFYPTSPNMLAIKMPYKFANNVPVVTNDISTNISFTGKMKANLIKCYKS
jgi:hypothetical protein